MIFNPATLEFESARESALYRSLRFAVLIVATFAMVILYFWIFTAVFGFTLPKTAILQAENDRWSGETERLLREMEKCELVLSALEERDNDVFRTIYGLAEIERGVQLSPSLSARMKEMEDEGAGVGLRMLEFRMKELEERTCRQSVALDEVGIVSREAGDIAASIPAVSPIVPRTGEYRLSSGFGYRSDPVYGRRAFHKGQDFATKKGTPVYATGGGVVESVHFSRSGYGNVLVINHGYGYRTLYAHLNTVEVQKGVKVERGDRIATVGSTGKSTGPHLHYEVIYRGKNVKPGNFFDMDQPVDEYVSMIDKRAAESTLGKMESTSELLKREKK